MEEKKIPLQGWKSVTLREEVVKKLTRIAGKMQQKKGQKVTLSEALEKVLDSFQLSETKREKQ
jgi:hypothetical protein